MKRLQGILIREISFDAGCCPAEVCSRHEAGTRKYLNMQRLKEIEMAVVGAWSIWLKSVPNE